MTLRHICNDRCDGAANHTKSRRRDDIRLLPSVALTVTAVALLAFVTMHPRAAMWACVVALVLAVGGLFTLAKEALDLRAELAAERSAREETAQQLEAERNVRRHTEAAFAEFQQSVSDAGGRVVIPLRPVPMQRTGEHDRLAMSAEEWAAIERETREL